MAYGARLESVLGASPRGFESPILRHRTPEPVEVPGFLLPLASLVLLVVPLVFRAPSGPATVCAAGRRPAREPSASRASLGASSRSPARPRRHPPAPRQLPPAPSTPAVLCRWRVARCVVSKPVLVLPSFTVARCRHCLASPDYVCGASLHARPLMSHVIPVRLFQDLNCIRWYFNVSVFCCGVGPIELRAILLRNRQIGTCWCRTSFA